MSKLTLMLFGPPRVELDDEPVEINRRKAQALLAYLAVSRQPHSRDALATLFYPDQDQRRARAYLRRDLAVLNAGLDGTWFDADRETVELAAQGDMWLDIARFRRIDAAVQQHHPSGSGLCADCLTQLREAAGLYTDNFLAGFTLRDCPEFDDWQFFQAESLRQDLAGVLERLVAGHNDLKDYAGAIPYARRWVALDPLHEPPQRILIRLYDQAGQPSAAVRLYEEYAALLEAEMGIPPDEETVTLFEAVKAKRMLGPALKLDKVAAGSRAQPSSPNPTAKKQMPAVAAPTRSAAPMPVPGHQLPTQTVPMIGRDSEYQQLLKTVEGTLRGRGQLILIEGEPGIGKSRLAQEVLDQAYSRGMATLWQKCYQSEQSIPYQALIDLATQILTNWPADTFAQIPPTALAELTLLIPELKTHFPDLPDPPGGLSEARQARLFRALQQFMLAPATNGPLALVMDDIQWADQITLQFMIHLARYLADQPVLLICTYRTEEVATTEHLTEAIHALRSEPHTIHTLLTRLSLQSTDQLVESLAGVPHAEALKQWLHRETDGNPFFMMSILQSLQEQDGLLDVSEADWSAGLKKADTNLTLPDALRRSVQDRLRRVPPAARSLLDVVAVYGRRFDFNTLQMISDERTMTLLETIEELLARQMLREEKEDFYDFNHDKIREVVYHDLSRTRCMLLHRQVAEAIESAAPDQVGTLAEHFELGGAWDKAVIYLNKAAERARRLFAMQEALDFYDRAIDLAERHPRAASKDNLLDLHQQRGETRGLIGGHVAEAVADLLLVLDAARTNNDLIRERNVLLRIGQVHRYGDHYQQALDYTREALHVARQSGDDHGIADALYHVGATVWSQGLNEQALPCHQEAVEITERQNFTDLVAVQAFHGLGEAYFLAGRAEEAIALYEKSLVLARQIKDKGYESENLGNMGMAMLSFGIADYDRARRSFTQSLRISEVANLEWHSVQVLGPLGLATGLSGDYRQGLDYLSRSLSSAEAIGAARFQSLLLDMIGMLYQELDQLDEARAAHERAAVLAEEAGAGWWLPRIRANLAIARLRLKDFEVEAILKDTLEDALSRRLEIHAVRCLEGLAELALTQDNPQQAAHYAGQLQRLAEPGGMREVVAQAHRWRGEALLAQDELALAAVPLQAGLELAKAIGRPRLLLDFHRLLAKLHQRAGEAEKAARHERQAKQFAHEMEAKSPDTGQLKLAEGGVELNPPPTTAPGSNDPLSLLVKSAVGKRFKPEKLIASGGMGEVYLGKDTNTGGSVAIKRLRSDLADRDPKIVHRLIQEGEILRQLNHPNIVKILAAIDDDEQPMIIMEYVPGGSLQDLLDQQQQLPMKQALTIALELADALTRAHHLGVIHRDIKPSNVLLAQDGTPRLSDFGVAHLTQRATRLTQEGAILGTTVYLSPEAWRGEELDARSDIWSFGALLYEMLAGRPPFNGEQVAAVVTSILNDPVPNLYEYRAETPSGLVELIEHMLTKERGLRIDSMRQVAAGLELIQRGMTL